MTPRDGEFTTLGIDARRHASDLFSEFRFATWSVWRSGQLSSLSPVYEKRAAYEYDDFLREHPMSPEFFAAHPPRPGEIFINVLSVGEEPGLVLTNQRLWLNSKKEGGYLELNLADIAQLESSNGWSASVKISFKDNTQREYRGLSVKPNDRFIARILERCDGPEGFAVSSQPTPAELDRGRQSEPFPERKQIGRPYIPYMLVGVIVGSVIGGFFLDGRVIGSCAFLGIVLGYLVWQVRSLIRRNR